MVAVAVVNVFAVIVVFVLVLTISDSTKIFLNTYLVYKSYKSSLSPLDHGDFGAGQWVPPATMATTTHHAYRIMP